MSYFNNIRIMDGTGSGLASVEARKQTPTGSALNVQIGPGDVISNVPVVIEYDHHQVHEGEVFQWSRFIPNLNGSFIVRVSVPQMQPTVKTPHVISEVVCDSTAMIGWLEGVTWSGTGLLQTKFNRNRNISITGSVLLYTSGVGADGFALSGTGTQFYQGATLVSVRSAIATESRAMSEFILKSGTEYAFVVNTAGAGSTLIRLNWYEDLGV